MNETQRLWAPWRLDFVTGLEPEKKPVDVPVGEGADPNCFICQALWSQQDKERHVFFRSDWSIGILNRFPYNNGHLLIAPKRHCANLSDLTGEEQMDLIRQIDIWVERLKERMKPDGFNVGLNLGLAAGAGLPGHLHWHVVPRWDGDTNFMCAVGSTKVIPQSLDALLELITR
ncbi:MAG: HIT family protein [Thermoguttaceae bacterium]